FMLDQCHNIEPKVPAMIRSVMNVQEATAKALLVDTEALAAAQAEGDVLGANGILMDAFNTDARAWRGEVREQICLHPEPLAASQETGPAERGREERKEGQAAGWGA